ncbi:Uncharacterized protein BM_BM14349 [Brugia malayi]|uniref:Bm14349 n=2 Tax=Brugia TaxID=6278 RepID=A0A0J9Y3X0_BRUMA|nr:Uncharacterized protein BM_BM14349 [Brugia malayi]CDQ01700.1 Bm14349 [Brugia malayi]VDO45039.1 unnamed protein product [Brugia timori]VIO95154.1 Uncharacterized protein BM_BM14349 [Brugia malayi]
MNWFVWFRKLEKANDRWISLWIGQNSSTGFHQSELL